MLSRASRNLFIARSFGRRAIDQTVIREEIDALKRLDIPYFLEQPTGGLSLLEDNAVVTKIIEALRQAVHR
jgi:hypothetical protein